MWTLLDFIVNAFQFFPVSRWCGLSIGFLPLPLVALSSLFHSKGLRQFNSMSSLSVTLLLSTPPWVPPCWVVPLSTPATSGGSVGFFKDWRGYPGVPKIRRGWSGPFICIPNTHSKPFRGFLVSVLTFLIQASKLLHKESSPTT